MRIILSVTFLALCVLGKGEDVKGEKSDVTKRDFLHTKEHPVGLDFSQTLNGGLNGITITPQPVIGFGFGGHSNLYSGELAYGKDFGYALKNINVGNGFQYHHPISPPAVTFPQVITRTVTVDKPVPIPQAVPVHVERTVSVPVAVPQPYAVPVNKPYPVEVVKPVAVPVVKEVRYPVVKPVPYPVEKIVHYPVEKRVYYPVHIPVERRFPVHIPRPYPVYQEKTVHYPVERVVHVPQEVRVNVPVRQPVPVPVERPYPVRVPHPVAVPVERPVAVPVPQAVPFPVVRKVAVPLPHPVPVHVEKHVPLPVAHNIHVPTPIVAHNDGIDIRHGFSDFGYSPGTQVKSELNGAYVGSQLAGSHQVASHLVVNPTTTDLFSKSHQISPDYSTLCPSQSLSTFGLDTTAGSTFFDIQKSLEIPSKVYRSIDDKPEAEAKASELSEVKIKKDKKV